MLFHTSVTLLCRVADLALAARPPSPNRSVQGKQQAFYRRGVVWVGDNPVVGVLTVEGDTPTWLAEDAGR